jgi:hypothetical protein
VAHSGRRADDGMTTAVACGIPPWSTFLINERKHTIAMACTVLVPRDKIRCLREFKIFIATFLMNLVVLELPREHRAARVLRRHVVPRWGWRW